MKKMIAGFFLRAAMMWLRAQHASPSRATGRYRYCFYFRHAREERLALIIVAAAALYGVELFRRFCRHAESIECLRAMLRFAERAHQPC